MNRGASGVVKVERELWGIARVGVNFGCCNPPFFFSGVLNPTGLGQRKVDCRAGSIYRIEGSRTRGYESAEVSDEQVFGMLFRQRKKGVPARGGWSQKKDWG